MPLPTLDGLLGLLGDQPSATAYALLGAAALVEYLFPPFPGDLVVAFGAFLVARRGWPARPVFGAVLVGSVIGLMLVYAAGRRLAVAEQRWTRGWLARVRPRVDALVARFERHGVLYICLNRFLPSVRALFFLAAGLAGLRWSTVLVAGAVSAAAWNGVLFLVGRTVGSSWERVRVLSEAYGLAVWGALVVGLVGWLVWRWRRRAT